MIPWRRITALTVGIALTASALTVGAVVVAPTHDAARAATSTAAFDAGNIISNETFFDSSTMSASDIQTFLDAKVPACRAGATCLKDFAQATTTRAADLYCSTYQGSSLESAATIVQKVSAACGINPQVLLVMMQKEEGLVLSASPSAGAYTTAMGYGCPDTAACNTAYYGFFNQVWNAAHQMQKYTKNSSMFSFQPGRNNIIQYNPSSSCGARSVFIENQATANLYIYTPYTPNSAALAAGYGSAPCGAYGNRNFFLYFSDWFGSPSNWLAAGGFEGGASTGWAFQTGVNHAVRTDPATAQAGDDYLVANSPVAGRSLSQSVVRATSVGEQANAALWVRSSGAAPVSGVATLTGLGGTTESASKSFTVGTTWTQVILQLPVRSSGHSGVQLAVAVNTTAVNLYVDSATLAFGQAPIIQNRLANASFEGTFAKWTPGNGFINQQIYKTAQAKAGSWFAASNTSVGGRSFSQTVPVASSPGDRWTASIWLRSSSANPFTGKLALWGLGGATNVNVVKAYSVGSTWTRVQVTLDTSNVVPKTLKLEVYMDTVVSRGTLWLDGGILSKNILTTGALTATTSTVAGSSLSQDVAIVPSVGDTYTAEVWITTTGSTPFSGRLALWGLGTTNAAASRAFTTTGARTLVQVTLPITTQGYTALRFQLYEDSSGSTITLDGAQLY